MAGRTDVFDLATLALRPGEGRRRELAITLDPLTFGGQVYALDGKELDAVLDVSRMAHGGYALRLRYPVRLTGPCQRCLDPAAPELEIDVREVHQENGGEELMSPYVTEETLDLTAWARDALVLSLPDRILCREDCAGLCAVCGANVNDDPGHDHGRPPDPRWAALRDIQLG